MKQAEFIKDICSLMEIDQNILQPETNLKGIAEFDSLFIIALIAYLDEKFRIKLSAQQINSVSTVKSLMELIGKENFN